MCQKKELSPYPCCKWYHGSIILRAQEKDGRDHKGSVSEMPIWVRPTAPCSQNTPPAGKKGLFRENLQTMLWVHFPHATFWPWVPLTLPWTCSDHLFSKHPLAASYCCVNKHLLQSVSPSVLQYWYCRTSVSKSSVLSLPTTLMLCKPWWCCPSQLLLSSPEPCKWQKLFHAHSKFNSLSMSCLSRYLPRTTSFLRCRHQNCTHCSKYGHTNGLNMGKMTPSCSSTFLWWCQRHHQGFLAVF